MALSVFAILALSAAPATGQLPDSGPLTVTGVQHKYNGVYVDAYTGAIPGFATIDLYCVDFQHHAVLNQPWQVNFTSLDGGFGSFNNTRWGAGNLDNYKLAAFLTTKFDGLGTDAEKGQLHGVIWRLFNDTEPTWGVDLLPQLSGWLTEGQNFLDTVDPGYWSDWYLATDVNIDPYNRDSYGMASGGHQEYLVHVTPEPATILLLASGLALTGVFYRRRRRAA